MYLTTRLLDPSRGAAVDGFDEALQPLLPPDYSRFLREYGPGTYAGEVSIAYPDPAVIPATFGHCLDLWDFDEAYKEADLLHSTQLAWTADGDILCLAPNRADQVFVLPRHSEKVRAYSSFFAAVKSLLPPNKAYFDPDFEAVHEQISLAKHGQLLDINPLHQSFLGHFQADFVANAATHPIYFFQDIGGWVSFDLVYRSSITIKYQRPLAPLVQPMLELLRRHIA